MKKLNATIFLFLLFSFSSSAQMSQMCESMFSEAEQVCTDTKYACENLGECQEKRESCNIDINSPSGCETLTACLEGLKIKKIKESKFSESKKERLMSKDGCMYSWYQMGPSSYCQNTNGVLEIVSQTCPGRQNWVEPYQDRGFKCEAHKLKVRDYQHVCRQLNHRYVIHCQKERNYRHAPKMSMCNKNLAKHVSEPSDVYGAGTRVVDGRRLPKSIVESYTGGNLITHPDVDAISR